MEKEKELVLVLDATGSMKEPVHKGKDLMSKRQKLVIELRELLSNVNEGTKLTVFSFGSGIGKIYKGTDKAEAMAVIEKMEPVESHTAIWDSLDMALAALKSDGISEALVACITDGEDNSSKLSQKAVTGKYEENPGLTLKILILNELLGEAGALDEEQEGQVVHITDFKQIKEELHINNKRLIDYEKLPINSTVINLTEEGETAALAAGKAMRKIVPFLEKATGLRYYPVPTFIVDRKVAKKAGVELVESLEVSSIDPSEVLVEISRLITGVCLPFHVSYGMCLGKSLPEELLKQCIEGDYRDFLVEMNDRQRRALRILAEAFGNYVQRWGEGETPEFEEFLMNNAEEVRGIRGIYSKDPFIFTMRCIERIAKVLREMSSVCRKELYLIPAYFMFHESNDYRKDAVETKPNLAIWSKYAEKGQIEELSMFIDNEGHWIKRADMMARALEIAVDILKRAYKDVARAKVKFMRIIGQLRAFGCYVAPGKKGKDWLEQMLFLSGSSSNVSVENTGYVLIYQDVCMEQVGFSKDSPILSESEIWPAFLESVLCHEHFHAITHEGIDGEGKVGIKVSEIATREGRIVSEGTAEWSEIEFSRGNADMTNITIEHAKSGELPSWPYRGAVKLEEQVQKEGVGIIAEIIKDFRAGKVQEAHDRFNKQ